MKQKHQQLSSSDATHNNGNIWSKWSVIIAFATFVVSIAIAWWNNKEKSTSLNIEKLNTTLLTQQPEVNGLTVNYVYHDSIEVKNLWRTTFVIKNTGENTIYGEGFNEQSTRMGGIPLETYGCDKILSFNISSSNNSAILENSLLKVHQWRPGEYVEIVLLSEGEKSPFLRISDREIKDSNITYSTYSPEEDKKDHKLINKIPKWIADTIKWFYTFVLALVVIGMIRAIPSEFKKSSTKQEKIITVVVWTIMTVLFMTPILWMF